VVASRIGEALGLRPEVLSMATNSDIAVLTGLSPAWKGARLGRLATDILLGPTASMFYVLDEIDKLRGHNEADPHNVLLTLLEAETARRFRDELLDIPFNAEHPYWVMTSNNRNMPAPLLDRLLVIDIPPLDEETRMMIARDLFDQANRDNNGAFALPGEDVLAAIAKMGLRDAKRAILFAMGRAVRDDRLALTTADVDASCRVIEENRETRAKIGFAAKI
jgi:ATP-dependent Lon protease